MSILEIDQIEVFYNEFQALFGISLAITQGDTVAIVGANGAGKSTLMRTICGMLSPKNGFIRYQGEVISDRPAYDIAHLGIAMVPEGRRIFPSMTVEENLKIGGYTGRKGMWTLDTIYDLFPILKKRRKNGGTQLSGGQQQMVAIGRALMSNPDLILMDEISLGLAPVIVKDIYKIVRTISEQGITVILVEQDVSRGMKEADYFYCLLEGKVSLAGKPDEVDETDVTQAYFGV